MAQMVLIQKGRKNRSICRDCRELHETKDCPVYKAIKPITMRTLKAEWAREEAERLRLSR